VKKDILLPAWLSVLSLAVALIVPLGVTLIADTSMDTGGKVRNVVHDGMRFVPPDASAEQGNHQELTLQTNPI